MKKLLLVVSTVLFVLSVALFAACGGSVENTPSGSGGTSGGTTSGADETLLTEITGVTFNDASFDYDGTTKTIAVSGEIPKGVTVTYTNNEGTDAGEYDAKAKLSGDGFKTLELSAKLIVNKIELTGISAAEEQSVLFDNEFHLPELTGTLPKGIAVAYSVDGSKTDGLKARGKYVVKIVLSGKNYIEKTFEVKFNIRIDAVKLAKEIVDSLGELPEPWNFLPESFSVKNRTLTVSAAPDFSSDERVSNLPRNGIGKQLNVVYGVLNKTTLALSYVGQVYKVLSAFQTAYVSFITSDPANEGKPFEYQAGAFTLVFSMSDTEYLMSASIGGVEIKIFADKTEKSYGARVALAANTALKFVVKPDYIKIGLNVLNTASTQIEFVKANGEVAGYIYEYLTVKGKEVVATSALVKSDKKYTTLIGTKGDFIPTSVSRNCEVYRNSDGTLVGTEVREELTVKGLSATYNTLWYNLYDLSGVNTIRKVDEMNGTNADTIYINGNENPIKTKLVLGLGKKAASRRFDIEFKKQYFYNLNEETGEYEQFDCEIPMLFIQEENVDTFLADFADANKHCVSAKPALIVSESVKAAVKYGYYELLKVYDNIKDSVSQQAIISFCAESSV